MDHKFDDKFGNNNLPYLLAMALENSQKAEQKAQLDSKTDPLTGIGNLRALDRTLNEAMGKLQSKEHKPGVDPDYYVFLLFDLNRLKFLNDTYGHDKGNEALRRAVEQFQEETT